MDPNTGRFVSEDPYVGSRRSPTTLHRFIYANSSPVDQYDPSGKASLYWWFMRGNAVHKYIEAQYCFEHPGPDCETEYQLLSGVGINPSGTGRVDIADFGAGMFFEIKSSSDAVAGRDQIKAYQQAFRMDPRAPTEGMNPGSGWPMPPRTGIPWPAGGTLSYWLEEPGLILYRIQGDNPVEYTWSWVRQYGSGLVYDRELASAVMKPALAGSIAVITAATIYQFRSVIFSSPLLSIVGF
ncbi:MAG: hypothetical protein H6827_10820 [Planctomycetes bacterium]|nr:hypothetical protein [Planctomycetota bacterium]